MIALKSLDILIFLANLALLLIFKRKRIELIFDEIIVLGECLKGVIPIFP